MRNTLSDGPVREFETPEGIVFAKIDPFTGFLPNPGYTGIEECFKKGTAPVRRAIPTYVVAETEKIIREPEQFFKSGL